jgi:hypothetical protein
MERSIPRSAIERDTRLDPVEDESVALGPGDADVGLGVDFQIDRAAVAALALDDVAGVAPAAFLLEQGVIDDDPEFVVRKIDRALILIPGAPRIGAD